MATVGTQSVAGLKSPADQVVNGSPLVNGGVVGHGGNPQAAMATNKPKKAKGKKPVDASETGKLLAAKINQLEAGAAEEKDQEIEIGGFSVVVHDRIPFVSGVIGIKTA